MRPHAFYEGGLLSFGPSDSVITVVRSPHTASEVLFMQYESDEDPRLLFKWPIGNETINDFDVGPRLLWDRAGTVKKPGSTY